MKDYFTISEFAKLRNININSLRYYEKLGLLKPARVDEKTKYRYYSADQLQILDMILLCISLDIPLKNMMQYINEDGSMKFKGVLEEGKVKAQQRIEETRKKLDTIEYFLEMLETRADDEGNQGSYHRELMERRIVMTKRFRDVPDLKTIKKEVAKLYKRVHAAGYSPVLPEGQMLFYENGEVVESCFFLEIANKEIDAEEIGTLSQGTYECIKLNEASSEGIREQITAQWGTEEDMVIIVNDVLTANSDINDHPAELQKLIKNRKQKMRHSMPHLLGEGSVDNL